MLIESIWAAIYSCVSITLIVSALAGLFYVYGRVFIDLLRLRRVESNSIFIATGMATTTCLAWYSFKLGIPMGGVIAIIFFTAIAILIFKLIRQLKHPFQNEKIFFKDIPRTSYYLPILALLFSVQAIIAFGSPNHLVGRIGNNDIFSWTLVADQLLGATNIGNIFPGGSSFAQSMRIDAWGTYFMLATTAKFVGLSALESTPYFTIFCLTLISFSAYEIVKKSFDLTDIVSFYIATLTGAGSFLFYIAYNGFYAQLLATFLYMAVILTILETADSHNNATFIKKVIIYVLPFIGLLLVYQSGFLVFTLFSILYCTVYVVFTHFFGVGSPASTAKSSWLVWLPLPCGALLSLVLLPELTLHTINRTMVVADAAAGWPLALISPAYLLAIPALPSFPELTGRPVHYIAAIVALIIVFTFTFFGYKKRAEKLPVKTLSFFVFCCLSLATYMLAYMEKGGTYQVWKLAAFIVLPTSFVANALFAANLSHSKVIGGKLKRILFFIFSCGLAAFLVAMPARYKLDSFSNKIDHLHSIENILHNEGIQNVILATAPFGETMAAFNILSKDFRLYPLSISYLPPANFALINQLDPKTTRVLMPAKCDSARSNRIVNSGYNIIASSEVQFSKIYFNVNDADCAVYSGVKLIEGFSGAESWGTWTIGNKARLAVNVPQKLLGKDIVASFELNPFGNQNISVMANGRPSGSYLLTKSTVLKIDIPANVENRGVIDFEFLIGSPHLAKEFNPDNNDPRLLGLGFVSLSIVSHN